MSIQKTPSGRWQARWLEVTEDGVKHRAQTFRLRSEAQHHLDDLSTDRRRGDHIDGSRAQELTLREWADTWLTASRHLRAGGRESYERDLRRYILPALGDVTLAQLDAIVVERFLAAEGRAPSTVRRHRATLHRMLQVATDWRIIARNPVDKVKAPRVTPTEMRFLTPAQVELVADAMPDRHRALILIAAWGGLRWAECVGLRARDVQGSVITVRETLQRRKGQGWVRDEPKSAKSRRSVHLPSFVRDEMHWHEALFVLDSDPDALVFTDTDGGPMQHSNVMNREYKPALFKAGVDPKTRFHDLRHTAAALAIKAGAHPKAIQARLGHASITMTLDRYGHLYPEQEEAVAVELEKLRPAP